MLGIKNTIIAVLITLALGYVYANYKFSQGISLGRNQAIAEQSMIDEAKDEQLRITQEVVAKELSKIKIENKTIVQKATKEVYTNEVYRDCIVPPSGVSIANEATKPRGKTSDSGN